MHWLRQRSGITDMRPELLQTRRSKSIDEAFERYVMPGALDECWEWMGSRLPRGYGTYGRAKNKVLAHRAALARSGVEVPKGMKVLHSCDNPPCCNPAHLRVGTQADNVTDMWARGRANISGLRSQHWKQLKGETA